MNMKTVILNAELLMQIHNTDDNVRNIYALSERLKSSAIPVSQFKISYTPKIIG